MKAITTLILLFISLLSFSQNSSEKKVALVIGNANYLNISPLKNSLNDVNDIAAKLQSKGFEVIKVINGDRRQIKEGVIKFSDKLEDMDGEGVGLFYYAGHGIQVDGENYLVPIGAAIEKKYEVPDECISASMILRALEYADNRLNIIIMDACRNNPFRGFLRGDERGFKRMDAPRGSILCYATNPGNFAQDGDGRNGTYTEILLRHMDKPGVDLLNLFNDVSNEVSRKTKGAQVPWQSNSGIGKFYFTPEGGDLGTNTTVIPTEDNITPELGATKQFVGSIDLITEISGDLYLDGKLLGTVREGTEVPINKVKTGQHKLEIRGEKNWSRTLTISKDRNIIVKAVTEDIEVNATTAYKKGNSYYLAEKYNAAVKWYRIAANQGYARAQTKMGYMYAKGLGLDKDDYEAFKWFRKAADQGYAHAQTQLGVMYYKGYGLDKDYYEAFKWFRKAADQGSTEAQNQLGVMYYKGYGLDKDYYEAFKWFRKAADQGYTHSQDWLGTLYERGHGVDKNSNEAIKWYRKAAEQGSTFSKKALERLE